MQRKYGTGSLSDLIHVHKNRPALVIGGAPCWPDDYKQISGTPIHLSANDHGCKLVPCNYLVCCDDIGDRAHMYNIPIISRFQWADYRVYDIPLPNSAAMAAFAAWVMGCTPIIIIGVECYTGKAYHDDPNALSSGFFKSKTEHLARWSRLKQFCPANPNFCAVSGPLLEIFPQHRNLAPARPPADADVIRAACTGTRVIITQDCELNGRKYTKGTVSEVDQIEERMLNRRSQAKLYAG